jgi:hypothetical protein
VKKSIKQAEEEEPEIESLEKRVLRSKEVRKSNIRGIRLVRMI